MSSETELQAIAGQLRKPHGEGALKVAEVMNKGNRGINLLTIEKLSVTPGDSILEIGMGNGAFVKEITGKSPSLLYTGYDYSPEMVFEANRINKPIVDQGQAMFVTGHARALPFPDQHFNKAFTVNTIYFWEDPSKVFSEIRRVLKPGGKWIISVRPKQIMQHYPFVKFGFEMYSAEELSNLMTGNHFRVTDVFETDEPDYETPGGTMKVASLIVTGVKED